MPEIDSEQHDDLLEKARTEVPDRAAMNREPEEAHTDPVDHEDLPWAPWMEGLEVKLLRASVPTNEYTLLSKFAPGVELPTHRHFGPVHAWTFQGRWHYKEYDWFATAGTYVREDSLGTHTFKVPDDNEEDTIVVFFMSGGLVLVNDDGSPWWYEDAETALDLYRNAVEGQGLDFPEHLILT